MVVEVEEEVVVVVLAAYLSTSTSMSMRTPIHRRAPTHSRTRHPRSLGTQARELGLCRAARQGGVVGCSITHPPTTHTHPHHTHTRTHTHTQAPWAGGFAVRDSGSCQVSHGPQIAYASGTRCISLALPWHGMACPCQRLCGWREPPMARRARCMNKTQDQPPWMLLPAVRASH